MEISIKTLLNMTTEELQAVNEVLDTMSMPERIELLEKISVLKGFVRMHIDNYH